MNWLDTVGFPRAPLRQQLVSATRLLCDNRFVQQTALGNMPGRQGDRDEGTYPCCILLPEHRVSFSTACLMSSSDSLRPIRGSMVRDVGCEHNTRTVNMSFISVNAADPGPKLRFEDSRLPAR